jgi:threonine dehydrogenase-like Zn-dependent dehydrogenase
LQGLGPIGQCVIKWAKLKGASRIIGIDCIPERLKFAKEQSGAEVVNFSVDRNVSKKLLELVPGGLDVALDCGVLNLSFILVL